MAEKSAPHPEASPEISVVIPMKNEEGNVQLLLDGLAEACAEIPHEIIVVDDGSTDRTAEIVRAAHGANPAVRLIRHAHSGVLHARAPVICTLDGDGQNPPASASWPGSG